MQIFQQAFEKIAAYGPREWLFVALGLFTFGYLLMLARTYRELPVAVVSFVANFFDTLGIGSYATTTSMVRQWKLIPDEWIPGSLNVGYVLPTVVQAFIYTRIVPVDTTTLILMIAASILGAWL